MNLFIVSIWAVFVLTGTIVALCLSTRPKQVGGQNVVDLPIDKDDHAE